MGSCWRRIGENGTLKSAAGQMTISPMVNKAGLRKFAFTLAGSLSDKLVDEGLTNETVTNKQTSVKVRLIVNNLLYLRDQPQFYTAIQGLRGKSK